MASLNQIFFGPPGTGKTYATVEAALQILDPAFLQSNRGNREALKARFDALVAAEHVKFVTFHQSFSYEDFVEGLRADTDEDGHITYDVIDGIFKSLCSTPATAKVTHEESASADISKSRIWKMSLGNTQGSDAYVYDDCIASNFALLGYGDRIDFAGCKSREDVADRFAAAGQPMQSGAYAVKAVTDFVVRMKTGDLLVITGGNAKFRAIGEVTGDYRCLSGEERDADYAQCRPVKWLRTYSTSLPYQQLTNVKFTQRTLYELAQAAIDKTKLSQLLNADLGAQGSLGKNLFRTGEKIGGYVVTYCSGDVLELKKPKGNELPIGMSMLRKLAQHVRRGELTLDDIAEKRVFPKLAAVGTTLEPNLVNGYNNIMPALVERVLKGAPVSEADSPSHSKRVLIIDEINRGNISRIFGELITLIEPSKRAGAPEALEVTLPYSKERFSVPADVHLIGTMNTADRSLAALDIALRRRFTFIEVAPNPELLDEVEVDGVPIDELLSVMNERISVLLDRDHCLGHAYFLPLKSEPTVERLEGIFREQIIPLLQEYFFEDWQRIQWVLNDHRKEPTNRFLLQPIQNISELFGDDVTVSQHGERWELDPAAFKNIDAYLGIIDHTIKATAQPRYKAVEATSGDLTVRQSDSGTIEVLRNGVLVKPSKPVLRDLAETLNISTLTSSGTPLNTRRLGRKVIKSLGEQSA
ncbi:AAA family ATPase [Pseudomonas petrae]|uniref:AAA family ATPase n=1 Tax=Pseudomonas petrae TaxID=2912190 RepID=UPI001EF14E8C|nr:AAA family ATPase [Pseudomonas petrae]MCF7535474.1 AAA family ATPase [Pseudomonas petrae]MCF7540334.1 AAA family ATPase [Pseudomonas petrae]MCF7558815.1 AAA family ATPase [Pseudomonas petrae]